MTEPCVYRVPGVVLITDNLRLAQEVQDLADGRVEVLPTSSVSHGTDIVQGHIVMVDGDFIVSSVLDNKPWDGQIGSVHDRWIFLNDPGAEVLQAAVECLDLIAEHKDDGSKPRVYLLHPDHSAVSLFVQLDSIVGILADVEHGVAEADVPHISA
jgi:hypothetical protein